MNNKLSRQVRIAVRRVIRHRRVSQRHGAASIVDSAAHARLSGGSRCTARSSDQALASGTSRAACTGDGLVAGHRSADQVESPGGDIDPAPRCLCAISSITPRAAIAVRAGLS